MSTLLVRARLLGADDISFGRNSIIYVNYLGITKSIAQVNASQLPLLSQYYTVENLFDGSYGPIIYPASITALGAINAGSNLSANGTLAVTGNTTLSGSLTLPTMNVAGYVKNTAGGLLTGGNAFTITINDIPSDAITGAAAYAPSSTGTDAYSITLSPALTSYKTGQLIAFVPDTPNTGACSLTVNGVGAVSIKMLYNSALVDPPNNSILANQLTYVSYFAAGGPCWVLINPNPAASRYAIFGASAAGNWTCPSGVTSVYLTGCAGGGGGGCYSGGTQGTGGSAGIAVIRYIMSVTPGVNYAYSVGSGGSAGIGGGGGTGGNTTFGPSLTLTGGSGGPGGGGGSANGVASVMGLGGAGGNPGNAATGSGSGGGGGTAPAANGGAGSGGLLWLEW